jgi:hypothetical protein
VHVQKHVESEHKQNLEFASLVMLVEKHAKDLLERQDNVVLHPIPADGNHTESGVYVQGNVVWEHKQELE